jgi:hypothetical protein
LPPLSLLCSLHEERLADRDLVLTTTGLTSVSRFSKIKTRLNKRSARRATCIRASLA